LTEARKVSNNQLNFKLKSLDSKGGNKEMWKVKVAAASAETRKEHSITAG
jgi:hypothetical protein